MFDGLLHFAGHEVAFAESGNQIRPAGGDLDARFEKGDRVLKVVLRHADLGHEEDDIRVLGCDLVGAQQQVEGVEGAANYRCTACAAGTEFPPSQA